MTPDNSFISISALVSYFTFIGSTNVPSWFCGWNLYGGPGSAVNQVSLATNSFGHRNKLITGQLYASSANGELPYAQAREDFVKGMYDSVLVPMNATWQSNGVATWGNYVNYGKSVFSCFRSMQFADPVSHVTLSGSSFDDGAVDSRLLVNSIS
jgi:hypothetical protein